MPELALPAAFFSALQALTDGLEAEHVPHILVGGVAVSLLSRPRTTQP